MEHTLSDDLESLRGVGHGLLALVNTAILLAIVAVILAPGSSTAQVIKEAFAFLAWLVAQAIKPVSGGFNVQPSTAYAPAGGYAVSPGDSSSGASSPSSSSSSSSFPNLSSGIPGASGTSSVPASYAITRGGIVTGLASSPEYAGQQPFTGSLGLPPPAGQ